MMNGGLATMRSARPNGVIHFLSLPNVGLQSDGLFVISSLFSIADRIDASIAASLAVQIDALVIVLAIVLITAAGELPVSTPARLPGLIARALAGRSAPIERCRLTDGSASPLTGHLNPPATPVTGGGQWLVMHPVMHVIVDVISAAASLPTLDLILLWLPAQQSLTSASS